MQTHAQIDGTGKSLVILIAYKSRESLPTDLLQVGIHLVFRAGVVHQDQLETPCRCMPEYAFDTLAGLGVAPIDRDHDIDHARCITALAGRG